MKANAPEKIYIQSFNISEEDAKFDKSKMFFDDVWTEEPEIGEENIEYTRTDAFIEKADKWLNEHILDYVYAKEWGQGVGVEGELFDDFKNYMKGE